MWPFSRKVKVLGFSVQSTPPAPISTLRTAHVAKAQGKIAFEGPFPITDADGRFLCKNCGEPFDEWNMKSAVASIRETMLQPNPTIWSYFVRCRKCSRSSSFTGKDVVTQKPGDPFGPWTDDDLRLADASLTKLFGFTPAEEARFFGWHLHTVLFLYR